MSAARARSCAKDPLRIERVRNGRGLVSNRAFPAGACITAGSSPDRAV